MRLTLMQQYLAYGGVWRCDLKKVERAWSFVTLWARKVASDLLPGCVAEGTMSNYVMIFRRKTGELPGRLYDVIFCD